MSSLPMPAVLANYILELNPFHFCRRPIGSSTSFRTLREDLPYPIATHLLQKMPFGILILQHHKLIRVKILSFTAH